MSDVGEHGKRPRVRERRGLGASAEDGPGHPGADRVTG